uniref:Mlx interactor n=1 Tax=Leptinotarsa decemlineata TaxID=7539 RepID=A0A0F7IHC7_LEPDE|nr:MLX-interacting protein-like [Leptinotarsa decemlineata]AKG92766.1 Mlx interactor [Leptinotarsa decemlineata]
MFTIQHVTRPERQEKECIHSGHFMVSHFEAEEQDDEDNVAVPIPESTDPKTIVPLVTARPRSIQNCTENQKNQLQLAIDTSLAKLFQCMSLAYRQKLTSPKWNRFRGIRLRWKDKIRLNNVIWRCWHLQFIKKENTLVCQFASPLDVDIHNKPEAVVLEGKYWKRKLAAVTAEYKKWRMFYRNNLLGHATKEPPDILNDMDLLVWDSNSSENLNMMVDEDYMGLMSDTLFTTITNQPYVFPDTREIAKAGYADFIQPSLGPLQPTLDEFMDTSPFFPEFLSSKLATVPEESQGAQQPSGWGYMSSDLNNTDNSLEVASLESSSQIEQYQLSQIQPVPIQDTRQTEDLISPNFSDMMLEQQVDSYISSSQQSPFSTVISKNNTKTTKNIPLPRNKMQNVVYSKSSDNVYPSYSQQNISSQDVDRICNTSHANQSQASQQQQVQELQHQVQDIQHYKLVTVQQPDQKQSYKFSMVTTPTVKFTTSQVHQQMMQSYPSFSQYSSVPSAQNDVKPEPRRRGAPRGRGRSRSNTREPIKRPPLISAVSDPSLITPQNSLMLTQLLTDTTTATLYAQSRGLGQSTQDSNKVQIKTEPNTVPVLSQSSASALIIPAHVSIHSPQSSTPDSIHLTSYSNSSSPITDPLSQNIHSPTSSQSSVGSPCAESSSQRDRRVVHIHAEQKRRFNIKNGFDTLHSLIPQLNQNPNAKSSKAALLQKGADYIIQLRAERNQLKEEMDSLRQQIETLNTSISNCQSLLPATGAPVSRNRDSKMQEMFDEYVRNRTMDNWKFWIFSLMFKPLLNSFSSFVSSSSLDDLYSSTMLWVEQHCTLGDLRPVVLNSLRYLCTKTEILSEPEKLPEEARQIVIQSNQSQKN